MSAFEFTADLWRHTGDAAWYFVTLPHDVADDIDALTAHERAGFGSVRVAVTLGDTSWDTSIFPDTRTQSFLLPVKKAVRVAEGLDHGSRVTVRLALAD